MKDSISEGLKTPNQHLLEKYQTPESQVPIELNLDQYTLAKMGKVTSKLISDMSSNAFEVKFNQIDINKAKEQTHEKTSVYLESKRKTYNDVLQQNIIETAEEYFEIKQISD